MIKALWTVVVLYIVWCILVLIYCATEPKRYSLVYAQQTIGCENHKGFKTDSIYNSTVTCKDGYTFNYSQIYGDRVYDLSVKYRLENNQLLISLLTLGFVSYE